MKINWNKKSKTDNVFIVYHDRFPGDALALQLQSDQAAITRYFFFQFNRLESPSIDDYMKYRYTDQRIQRLKNGKMFGREFIVDEKGILTM